MLDKVFSFLESDSSNAVTRLSELLAIASVSTDPAYKGEIEKGAAWVAAQLNELGLETKIHETGGHPAVVATSRDEAVANPGAPRVLFYGHYDVQPPDPLELWDTPPFEPTVRDGKLFARGSSDDKGQVMCFIEALRGWKQGSPDGKLPCPVTVLIEGEEECGSENLPPFVEANKELLQADIAVVSDTAMWSGPDGYVPAITYALRGLLYFDIQLHGPKRDLHSGVFGGTLPNPATILTRIVGNLFDDDHCVVIPGYYDDVLVLSDEERDSWASLGFDERAYLDEIGVAEPYGESGYSTLERRWCRPACDVNGIYGGYMGEGAKTVIPTFAGAKVSFRLAANQDAEKIAASFEGWLRSQPTHGLTWKITSHGMARPVAVSTDSPFIAAAKQGIEAASGRSPVLIREGATIPIVADFKSLLGIDTLLIGFGQHDDALHSPNEKFELANFALGCRTHASLLAQIGALSNE